MKISESTAKSSQVDSMNQTRPSRLSWNSSVAEKDDRRWHRNCSLLGSSAGWDRRQRSGIVTTSQETGQTLATTTYIVRTFWRCQWHFSSRRKRRLFWSTASSAGSRLAPTTGFEAAQRQRWMNGKVKGLRLCGKILESSGSGAIHSQPCWLHVGSGVFDTCALTGTTRHQHAAIVGGTSFYGFGLVINYIQVYHCLYSKPNQINFKSNQINK